ncbi:hypothetical protein DFH11DRAFT_1729954 [Phellopilus nigrolimitatus]|nr:hypothetical protein DFH11DRAFT_1729954 [Phellopilus nigrolimitatus]
MSSHRLPPALPPSPFLELRHSPATGYSVFAAQPIPAGTPLLAAPAPATCVIYRAFRKEVCAWCFAYDRGRPWRVRPPGAGAGAGGGIVFCAEQCRDAWAAQRGVLGAQAHAALEALVQRHARARGWRADAPDAPDDACTPSEREAWAAAEEEAALVRGCRLAAAAPGARGASKAQKHALARALQLPVRDTDTLFFLLGGVLCRAACPAPSLPSPSPSDDDGDGDGAAWTSLLTLLPAPPYASRGAIRSATSAYLTLLAVLPHELLAPPTVLSRDTLETVLSRDAANSFGLWSTGPASAGSAETEAGARGDEGAEMLGYGTWPAASFFNHACAPSVAKRREGRRWLFAAARAVPRGAELCISYIRGEEDVLPLAERRARLQAGWGFVCRCAKCLEEEAGG